VLKTRDGGKGLIKQHQAAASRHGIEIWYSTPAQGLVRSDSDGTITGLVIQRHGFELTLHAHSVILASGGFEADRQLRVHHMGPEFKHAHVRGTPYNMGDGLVMASRDADANAAGDWTSCHSTTWDANTNPDSGDLDKTNQYTKSGYPLGIFVNKKGLRFVDEGSDLRNYT
jgi:aspartate oxidase